MKKVVILGGAGYLGSVLVSRLLESRFSVVVIDDFSFGEVEGFAGHKNLKILRGDIRNISEHWLKDTYAVINLVALSNDGVCDLYPQQAIDINVTGALRLANQAKKAGARRYLFASSCAIYGYGNQLSEDSPPSPKSRYAKLKLKAERLLSKLADRQFSVTFLRNGTLYGLSPKMRFDLMVNTLTLSAFRNSVIKINGSGNQWRPLTHVEDASSVFISTLKAGRQKISAQAFNVVSENSQVSEVAKKIKSILPGTRLIFNGADDNRSYSVTNDKIKRVLGFQPERDLSESIREIIKALEKNKITDGPESKVVETYKKVFEDTVSYEKN